MTPGEEIAERITRLKYFTQEMLARMIDNKIKEILKERDER